ncbi:MAG: E3 binding domain-containing protein [Roseiflexaceae bacterium]|nr:E3 binding domain-containing protein [Roseiflexaceae bacterium]
MAVDIVLPALPDGASEARVLRWLAEPGAALVRGQPLLIVLTEWAELALPAPDTGQLNGPLAAVGQLVPVGGALASVSVPQPGRATPVARRVAELHGVELNTLYGSGPGGRVMRSDVLATLALADVYPRALPLVSKPIATLATPVSPSLTPVRHAIIYSPQSAIPFAYTAVEVVFERERGCPPEQVLEALAQALLQRPQLGAQWTDDGLIVRRRVHLAVEGRLIQDAQDLNARGLARALRDGSHDLAEALFAVSFGAWWSGGRQGDLPGLHVGALTPHAVVVGTGDAERIAVRDLLLLTLRYDARVATQAEADAFLLALRADLQGPTHARTPIALRG